MTEEGGRSLFHRFVAAQDELSLVAFGLGDLRAELPFGPPVIRLHRHPLHIITASYPGSSPFDTLPTLTLSQHAYPLRISPISLSLLRPRLCCVHSFLRRFTHTPPSFAFHFAHARLFAPISLEQHRSEIEIAYGWEPHTCASKLLAIRISDHQ